ncbi:MAG: excinuclease ABC subunit A [Candidatus Rokubacteria bacterium RIFCSPHIGHO2_12_FULL_73_22]|nr:MAG: excinuclease ABC subunit A [Candidatus Rokubacteria bacterium RIFCSPHIGHO2_12_FULL_73_22]OGL22807.1 MAG: excinuclease ABC subunit A [Candidatus Rokubacteria bacterium RIFCSPLOWO2_12_FULL_73_47]
MHLRRTARMAQPPGLRIEGARQNNLKNISLEIPHDRLTVITGVSGSGKSSLAFDTLFAEGQWRYIESLSTYARMFLDRVDRPDVDRIEQIRPAVALEQKNPVRTARSTVGTATEVYDYLRLLYAKIGHVHCPACGAPAASHSPESIVDELLAEHPGARALIMFRLAVAAGVPAAELWANLTRRGFARVRLGDETVDLATAPPGLGDRRDVAVVLDRVVLDPAHRRRVTESVESALREGGGRLEVEVLGAGTRVFAESFRCTACGTPLERPQPLLFSFNHPLGACAECKGFGNVLKYDEALVVPDRTRSLAGGAVEPWTHPSGKWYQRELMKAARRRKLDADTPWEKLPEATRRLVYEGDGSFPGIQGFFEEVESYRYKLHVRVFLSRYRTQSPCPTCRGARLKPAALAVRVAGLTIAEFTALTIEAAARLLADLKLTAWEAVVAREILRQLNAKLTFLLRVGLGYLTLSRQTRTLSGGEAQRINLANQLGSQLVGTLYVLDEPSIGLHARDTSRLADLCRELAQAGNTVVVVEHDPGFIGAADWLVELGPGSGERGGEVVFSGPQAEFQKATRSLTARYVSGRETIPVPPFRRSGRRHLGLVGARAHNLKDVTLRVPLHTLSVVSGVSGSGKSTLVHDTLYRAVARAFKTAFAPPGAYDALTGLEYLKGVRLIDQEPIGRTPRSNPVTYVKAFDEIRRLFAALPRAKALGLEAGAFSFNVPGGRCEACQGDGFQKLEMYFVEDVYVTCQECEGRRYRPDVLTVKHRGRTVSDVLQMTVDDAVDFFAAQGSLARRLRVLQDVGLGYLRLGQPATTLSGGEAQRLKISAELGARQTSEMLYILDEPTTGLHLDDVKKLLGVLNRLVDAGNTVLVVEHHLDVIKCADWVVDLGPEGGEEGGEVVAEGTPEAVAQTPGSYTGKFLAEVLPKLGGKPRE